MADSSAPNSEAPKKEHRSIGFYFGLILLLLIVYVLSAIPIYWAGRNRVPNRTWDYYNIVYAPLNWTLVNSPKPVQDAYQSWSELWLGDPMKTAKPKPKPRAPKSATP